MKTDRFVSPLEVKFDAGDDQTMGFSGYGARFNNVDAHGDLIAPGAFRVTLKAAKKKGRLPRMLVNHGGFFSAGDAVPVGIWTDMKEDDKGLYVEGRLADTPRGRELYALLKMQPRPAIDGMSIGYRPVKWSMRRNPEDPRRRLEEIELLEISLVTFPANDLARVDNVKADNGIETIRDFEAFLRDVGGFSHAAAKSIAAGGYKAADPRDEDDGDIAALVERNIKTLSR